MNIASDYSKLGKMLDLCKSEKRLEILEKTISKEGVLTEITEKFNPEIEFTTQDFASLLFYLGYLTIEGEELGRTVLEIPNKIMKNIYSDYFLQKVNEQSNLQIDNEDICWKNLRYFTFFRVLIRVIKNRIVIENVNGIVTDADVERPDITGYIVND